MFLLKITPVFLLALAVGAEKKIELQDIEEDNLKSEKQKEFDGSRIESESNSGSDPYSLNFLKDGLAKYFLNEAGQQPRYVQQYAVTEPPEHLPPAAVSNPRKHYVSSAPQQAMIGYLSNVPMQIYLVPQHNKKPMEKIASPHQQTAVKYAAPTENQVLVYQATDETMQNHNYIEVPAYVTPSEAAYIQPYSTPGLTYVTYAHPTLAPTQPAIGPIVSYRMPTFQYQKAVTAPSVASKDYVPYYTDTNIVEGSQDEMENSNNFQQQTESPHSRQPAPEIYRFFNPIREQHRYSPISELPPPNPLLLRGPPSHLAHLPKALPMYRPLTKPVYATGGSPIKNAYTPRPNEAYAEPYKRRPTSLLDSYVPSNIQIEYLKRGYTKDPLQAYEALSRGRHTSSPYYERGFLPNQMYHTSGGDIVYGHYKRTPKGEKLPQKKK